MILMIVALIFPFLMVFGLSFTVETGPQGQSEWSLGSYQAFFDKPQYLRVLWRSVIISTIVAITTVLLAYPAAYFIAFHVKKNKMR